MRFKILATAMTVLAVTVAACSGNDSSDLPDGVNKADVTFAQQMIPHHEQATEMAALAPARTENRRVLEIAKKIEAAQDPEITSMKGWLKKWGVEQDSGSTDHGSMDHGSMGESDDSMPGMMSEDDLSDLQSAEGADFDRAFLTMMVEHHEGAVEMAQAEQSNGENSDAVALAKSIITTQRAEIAEMKKLLAQ